MPLKELQDPCVCSLRIKWTRKRKYRIGSNRYETQVGHAGYIVRALAFTAKWIETHLGALSGDMTFSDMLLKNYHSWCVENKLGATWGWVNKGKSREPNTDLQSSRWEMMMTEGESRGVLRSRQFHTHFGRQSVCWWKRHGECEDREVNDSKVSAKAPGRMDFSSVDLGKAVREAKEDQQLYFTYSKCMNKTSRFTSYLFQMKSY